MSRCVQVPLLAILVVAQTTSVADCQAPDPEQGAEVHRIAADLETPRSTIQTREARGPGTQPTFVDDTYSIETELGALIDGELECFSVHTTGLADNLVFFDGGSELLDPYLDGTQPIAFEFEDSFPSTTLAFLQVFSGSGGDLFPSGFVDPDTAEPLTFACLRLGFDDPLFADQAVRVVSATFEASGDSGTVVPPTDISSVFSDPWDGRALVGFEGVAGTDADIVVVNIEVEAAGTVPVPIGDELTFGEIVGSQEEVVSAARSDGTFVVAWQDRADGGSASTIRARHFTAAGSPTGPSVVLGAASVADALQPAIAAGNDDFLVVWNRDGGTDQEIFARRIDSSGSPVGSELQVNGYTTGDQSRPAVTANDLGEFLVVWQSAGSPGSDPPVADDTSGLVIVGRRVSTSGTPLASDYQVNSYTTDDQACPTVIEHGGFVAVAWQSGGTSTGVDCLPSGVEGVVPIDIRTGPGVFGQSSALDDLKLNTSTSSSNVRPKVAMRGNKVFVVWEGEPLVEGVVPIDIQGRRYSFTGLFEGPTITFGDEVVIDDAAADASRPDIVVLEDGFLAVTWDRDGMTDGDVLGKFGSTLTAVADEDEFQINTSTGGAQEAPALVATPSGFFVLWQSDPSNGGSIDDLDILGQRYVVLVAGSIFDDGFESGNTSAWSSTTP